MTFSNRLVPLLALAVGISSARVLAQEPVEDAGRALLSAERIAALPAAKRAAWSAYIDSSQRLHAYDTAFMNAELRAAGHTQMEKAPYRASNFEYFDRPDEWFFVIDSVGLIGDAVVSFQTQSGGWSKRTDMTRPRTPGMSYYSETTDWHYIPTLDNGATTGQIRFLGRVMKHNSHPAYGMAFHQGLQYLLDAQEPNGCWPQSFPLEGGYHDAITFNDDVTVLVLTTLDEAAAGKLIATQSERQRATASARRGVQCLVATQVVVSGTRTAWGQQHDPISLEIVPARKYELAGLAGRESAAIMTYLMSLPTPNNDVVRAVHGAAAWFRARAITGFRYDGYGLRADPNGEPIWARLTEIATNRPIFANRDAVKLYDWNKLTDRRSGYAWFGTEPAAALKKYDEWARAHPARAR